MDPQFRDVSLPAYILNGQSTSFVSVREAFLVFKKFVFGAESCYVVQASLKLMVIITIFLRIGIMGVYHYTTESFLFLIICQKCYMVIHYL